VVIVRWDDAPWRIEIADLMKRFIRTVERKDEETRTELDEESGRGPSFDNALVGEFVGLHWVHGQTELSYLEDAEALLDGTGLDFDQALELMRAKVIADMTKPI
jgi:hypothetical protein